MAKAPKRGGAKKAAAPRAGTKSKSKAKSSGPPKRSVQRSKPAAVSGGLSVLCSECYSEFTLNPKAEAGSKITCPSCMHMGEVAESDVMAQISIAKRQEGSWLRFGLISGIVLAALSLTYGALVARDPNLSSGITYGLIGAMALFLVGAIYSAVRYESNRYEVYF